MRKLCNVVDRLENLNISITYMFVKHVNDEYIVTLFVSSPEMSSLNVLLRLGYDVETSFKLEVKRPLNIILMDSRCLINAIKLMINEYGEVIKPIIYRLAYTHGIVRYSHDFDYIDRPLSKLEKILQLLKSKNWLRDFRIERVSNEYTELVIHESFETLQDLEDITYVKGYVAGFISKLFNRTYVAKEEKINRKTVKLKIVPYRGSE